ncbi:MAG: methyltransferase domain-containing protein [Phycisphaerae bacterium]
MKCPSDNSGPAQPVRPKWPKVFEPLTARQEEVAADFMEHWLSVLPQRYGAIERFNQSYSVRHRPQRFLRTLEIGGGRGEHLDYEQLDDAQRGQYHIVEVLPNLCEILRRRAPWAQVLQADCQERMPFPDGHFDRIIAIHVLEHLPNLPAAVRELHRLCRPDGGTLSAVIPCEGGLAYGLARRISAQRIFEKRYGMPYDWYIRRNHVNTPGEIMEELAPHFRVAHRSFFPLRVPLVFCNLVIAMTCLPRGPADGHE